MTEPFESFAEPYRPSLRALDQNASRQGNIPGTDIFGRRPQIAVREQIGGFARINGRDSAILSDIARRRLDWIDIKRIALEAGMLVVARLLMISIDSRFGGEVLRKHGAAQAERLYLVARDEVVVADATHPFDYQPEQGKICGALMNFCAGGKSQRLRFHERDELCAVVA
jgi:hypothetical protein